MEGSLREETNLAAFLACWICKFVLPIKKLDHIRPSVFKIGSLMAHGERSALAIPVLAGIYRGLTEITTSTNLGAGDIIFPIQYVYGWIGCILTPIIKHVITMLLVCVGLLGKDG